MLTEKQINEIRHHMQISKNPLLFFDDDPDGFSAYLILKKTFQKGTGICVKVAQKSENVYTVNIENYSPDRIFILDRAYLSQELLDKIKVPVIWLDHHQPLERHNVYYYNPMLGNNPDNRSTTYWAYQVAQKYQWIAAVGIISDWHIPDFYDTFEYKELFNNKRTPPEILFESKFGRIIRIFSFSLKGKMQDVKKSIKILETIEDPYELLDVKTKEAEYIISRFEKINKDYRSLLKKALKEEVNYGLFLFTYPSTKMSFTGELANEIIHRKKEAKIIIIAREKDASYRISMRGTDEKIPVLPILQKALEGLDGYGGGHMMAAGASVNSNDFPRFIEIIKEELKRIQNSNK